MTSELFVWYRCAEDQRDHVRMLARLLLADVQGRCGVQGRLLTRQDQRDTWMEHYAPAHGGESALLAAIDAALAALPAPFPERHTEAFTCLPG